MWFRVEVHKDGSLLSCEQVDVSLKSGTRVVFVEAESKDEAVAKAIAYVEKFRAKARVYAERNKAKQVIKRAERKKAGLCFRCPEPAVIVGRCEKHRREYNAQEALRDRNERAGIVKGRDPDAILAIAAKIKERNRKSAKKAKRNERRKVRLSAYRYALEAYDKSPASIRSWLILQIAALETALAPAAAPSEVASPVAAE